MKSVLCVLGTRPEVIKFAPVLRGLKDYFVVYLVCTGQHRELVSEILSDFGIKVNENFNIMKPQQTLGYVVGKVLLRLEELFWTKCFDLCLVQGDTSSALSAALGAFYNGVPVGHIEAGLRSGSFSIPFPEEMNRVLIDRLSTLKFAPTQLAARKLFEEGLRHNVYVTGNTVVDVAKKYKEQEHDFDDSDLDAVDWKKKVVFVTLHRRENWEKVIGDVCFRLSGLAVHMEDVLFLISVHPNPKVSGVIGIATRGVQNMVSVDPLSYEDTLKVLKRCYFVLTDSGGLQEEAPLFGKPVVVVRDVTERPEAVFKGVSVVAGTKAERVVGFVRKLITDKEVYKSMSKVCSPFGDGNAAGRIVEGILHYFGEGRKPKDFKG